MKKAPAPRRSVSSFPPPQFLTLRALLLAFCFSWWYGLEWVVAVTAIMLLWMVCNLAPSKRWLTRALDDAASITGDATARRGAAYAGVIWLSLGLLTVSGACAYLEWREPHYFTQDDNFCCMLPALLQGCRSFFSGVFPEWNPYQMLGSPAAVLGLYEYTYPPTFVAYAIAHFLLRSDYYTLEVVAWMHVLGGLIATYWAARQWRLEPEFAVSSGIAYMLSGYTLVTGRSWANMLVAIAWLPLCFGMVGRLKNTSTTWKWPLACGAAFGFFYHCGFVQMWVYTLCFFCALVTLLYGCGHLTFRRAAWGIPAVLIGIALAAPLLFVQMHFGSGVSRLDTGLGVPMEGLLATIVPYPFTHAAHPQRLYGFGEPGMGIFYFFGAVFALSAVVGFAGLVSVKWPRRIIGDNLLLVLGFISVLIALGDRGYAWLALRHLPWFDKFRNAERLWPFVVLFCVLGGGLALQRFLSGYERYRMLRKYTAGVAAFLALYTVAVVPPSHYSFTDDLYPALPPELAQQVAPKDPLRPQRVSSLLTPGEIPYRAQAKGFVFGMDNTFASVYSLLAFNGYDPLIFKHHVYQEYVLPHFDDSLNATGLHSGRSRGEEQWESATATAFARRIEAYQAYGVRDLFLFGGFTGRDEVYPLFGAPHPEYRMRPWPELGIYTLSLDGARPLAFDERQPDTSLPLRVNGRGVTVDVSMFRDGGPLVINFLAWPDFRLFADGVRVPFSPDDWGRMRVNVPPGTRTIEARYSPPWTKGIFIGGVIALTALAGIFLIGRQQVTA